VSQSPPAPPESLSNAKPGSDSHQSEEQAPVIIPGFIRASVPARRVTLTWNRDEADDLPERSSFSEGTCEC